MKLKVFGRMVPVKSADLSEEDSLGLYMRKTKTIIIDEKLEGEEFLHTLLHELFHAYSDRCSIRQGIASESEEIIADSFVTCLLENFNVTLK